MKMTVGQALVKFLDQQYISFDGIEQKFVDGVFTIFGHGMVLGIGQALEENPGNLRVYQGRSEQGMAHVAAAFAKQHNRRKIIACNSSIGPGSANMLTAAATASVNNVPLLLLTSDTFATRQPDPVLQQLEQSDDLSVTTNDAFKAVTRFWDRVSRPEQLMSAMVNAMRVLTDPMLTGAVCVALPQDVQAESYDYPDYFFQKRVHTIRRPLAVTEDIEHAVKLIEKAKKPILICGGGVRYSEAGKAVQTFCEQFEIPIGETQAGKSAIPASDPRNLGGIGVTGNLAANTIAHEADLVIGVGTRFSDFTTSSKALFTNPDVTVVTINLNSFHAQKLDAQMIIADAKAGITQLGDALSKVGYHTAYTDEIGKAKAAWEEEMKRLGEITYTGEGFEPEVANRDPRTIGEFADLHRTAITQTAAIVMIRELIDADANITGAAGSLPGDLQRMWTTDARDAYHMEYGYSCMGYEIQAALGCKLAQPEREAYAMCGDGSYLMLHSEMVTAIQEGAKINVLLFDNCGFGCINNLQMGNGVGSLATEFRFRDAQGKLNGELIPIDFAACAAGYGYVTYTARTMQELKEAILDSKKQTRPTLIDIKVFPKTMTHDYESWWNVGIASSSGKVSVREAFQRKEEMLHKPTTRAY